MLMSSLTLLILLVIFICIPVLIGTYVYRDAKSRAMNAALWTLIAILAPALIGFIIYLLVRQSYSDMKCPKCQTTVTDQYMACPNCGAKLKAACPNCNTSVETHWKVCPNCANPLPSHYEDVTPPIQKKDRTLSKILLVIVLIPAILFIIALFSFSAFSTTSGGTGVTSLPIDDYIHETGNTQIEQWLESSGADFDQAYALCHEETLIDGQLQVQYLIYMPCLVDMPELSIKTSSGFFGRTVTVDAPAAHGNSGNTLLIVTFTGDAKPKLKLTYDGEKVDCEVTDVDYPLGLSE